MRKSHLDKNIHIKRISYFLVFFICIHLLFGRFYKDRIIDFYTNVYTKYFIKEDEVGLLKEENKKLKSELENLYINNTEQVHKEEKLKANKINFSILNKDIIYSDIILNKGILDGVEIGDNVYVSNNKILGKIIETYQNSSKLRLFSFNNLETEIVLKNSFVKSVSNSTESIKELRTEILPSSSASSSFFNSSNIELETKSLDNFNSDYINFTAIGDGAYGVYIKTPDNFNAEVNDYIYTQDFERDILGKIIKIENISTQKEKMLYVMTNYSYDNGDSFYIKKSNTHDKK